MALEMSAMSDYEIQMKYGDQVKLISDRTYVVKQESSFAHTITDSINFTNALGKQLGEFVRVEYEVVILILASTLDQILSQIK